MILNIGFDADGVIYDTESFQLSDKIVNYVKENYNYSTIKNENGYGIKEVFGCTDEEEIHIWTKFIVEYSLIFKPRPWVKETFKHLRKNGHKVYIITSKACALEKSIQGIAVRALFETGLKMHGIIVDGIEYCSLKHSGRSKLMACNKHNIDIMVEDKKENIECLMNYLPVICVNTNNNRDTLFNENVYRVNDGNEIYVTINRLIANKTGIKNIYNIMSLKSKEEKQQMSIDERNEYYDYLKEYYYSLPYNEFKSNCSDVIIPVISYLFYLCFENKYHPIIIGEENLPNEQGCIFVSNHLCSNDIIFLFSELRNNNRFRVLAKKELESGAIGLLFKIADSVFVERNKQSSRKTSLVEQAKHLAHNRSILLFPEGTYNRTENALKDFSGYSHVYLSQVYGRPIVNLALTSNYEQRPILRIDKPYVVSRDMPLEQAQIESYNRLASLVEENNKMLRKGL